MASEDQSHPMSAGEPVSPDEVLPALNATSHAVSVDLTTDEGKEANEPVRTESINEPAKVLRIGAMAKQLLEEVRLSSLDEAGRARLREIYEQSVRELASGLSPDLVAELDRMALPFDDNAPSEAELRVAQAQLVGWLEGLFHGIQATLVVQQMATRAQLEELRQKGLPAGAEPESRPGTYL